MGPDQNRPLFNPLLPAIGLLAFKSGLTKGPCDAARHMAGRLPQSGRQGSIGHYRTNSGEDQCNSGKQVGAQLTQL